MIHLATKCILLARNLVEDSLPFEYIKKKSVMHMRSKLWCGSRSPECGLDHLSSDLLCHFYRGLSKGPCTFYATISSLLVLRCSFQHGGLDGQLTCHLYPCCKFEGRTVVSCQSREPSRVLAWGTFQGLLLSWAFCTQNKSKSNVRALNVTCDLEWMSWMKSYHYGRYQSPILLEYLFYVNEGYDLIFIFLNQSYYLSYL